MSPAVATRVNAVLHSQVTAEPVRQAPSPRSSAPLLIRKMDMRIIRKLPIPHIGEVLDSLGTGKISSTFDLMSAFFQTVVHLRAFSSDFVRPQELPELQVSSKAL